MLLADKANQYLDQEKPWVMIKNKEEKDEVQKVCTNALNMFLKLTIMLKPVMPDVARNVESFMNLSDLNWSNIHDVINDHKINNYENLALDQRIHARLENYLKNEDKYLLYQNLKLPPKYL